MLASTLYINILSVSLVCVFFFFKQKTAYEMRISDWSSDVCSSDLVTAAEVHDEELILAVLRELVHRDGSQFLLERFGVKRLLKIGRASCRERVCQYV